MTIERIHTRLATADDIPAIRGMYDTLKQLQSYPAFRSKAFHKAVAHIIENSSGNEQIFVATTPDNTPVGMAHMERVFSLNPESRRSAFELTHLYADESQSYTSPIQLVDHVARSIIYGARSHRNGASASLSIDSVDTNSFDALLTHYRYNGGVNRIRYTDQDLRAMGSRAIEREFQPDAFTEPEFVDPDNVVVPFPSSSFQQT